MGREHERTEEPTARRRTKARAAGQVARGPFVAPALSLLVVGPLAASLLSFAASWREAFSLATIVCAASGTQLDESVLLRCVPAIVAAARPIEALSLPWCGAVGVAITTAIALGSLGWAPQAIGPHGQRINVAARIGRLLSRASLADASAGALLLLLIACATLSPLVSSVAAVASNRDLGGALAATEVGLRSLWVRIASIALVFGAFDMVVGRRRLASSLRMTQRELKEERAETEARPEAKQRRKTVGLRRSRSLRLEAIRSATAVVTNPAHVAVALRYAPPEIDVPVVVARGADLTAAIVRNAARDCDVPIIESKELARALYARVEIDEPIPEDCYAAVAAIFAWIVRARGSLRTGAHETA